MTQPNQLRLRSSGQKSAEDAQGLLHRLNGRLRSTCHQACTGEEARLYRAVERKASFSDLRIPLEEQAKACTTNSLSALRAIRCGEGFSLHHQRGRLKP